MGSEKSSKMDARLDRLAEFIIDMIVGDGNENTQDDVDIKT